MFWHTCAHGAITYPCFQSVNVWSCWVSGHMHHSKENDLLLCCNPRYFLSSERMLAVKSLQIMVHGHESHLVALHKAESMLCVLGWRMALMAVDYGSKDFYLQVEQSRQQTVCFSMFGMCVGKSSCTLAGELAHHLLERHRNPSCQGLHHLENRLQSRAFIQMLPTEPIWLPCTRLRACSVLDRQTGLMHIDYGLQDFCLQMGQIITTIMFLSMFGMCVGTSCKPKLAVEIAYHLL